MSAPEATSPAIRRWSGVALLVAAIAIGLLSVWRPSLAAVAVGVVALLALSLVDLSWPVAALLLLTMVGGEYGLAHESLSVGGLNLFPNDMLVLLLAFALAIRFLRSGAVPSLPRDPIDLVLSAFLLYGLLSLARSRPMYGSAGLSAFRLQFFYGALFLLARAVLHGAGARRRLLIAVLIAAAAVGMIGIYNLATGTPAGGQTGSHTFRYLSGLQATVLFFGLAFLIGVIWPHRRPGWSLALGGLCVFGILISQARSVWIGAVLGLGAAVVSTTTWRRKMARIAVVVAVAVLIGSALLAAGVGRGLSSDLAKRASSLTEAGADVTTVWRLFVWSVALHDLKASPLLGLGLGRRFTYYDLVLEKWESQRQLHNSYLELAYYAGAIGVGLLIAFQLLVFARTVRAARRARGTPRESLLLALVASQVCLYAVAATNVVSASLVATTWGWVLAAVSVLEASATEEAA